MNMNVPKCLPSAVTSAVSGVLCWAGVDHLLNNLENHYD